MMSFITIIRYMGNSQGPIYNVRGQQVKSRKCILLITPPSYEVAKVVARLPPELEYEYVSVGQMIRDEINKRTNYSKVIMENLEKDRKINERILDILLKNASLLGNFAIRYAPIDQDEVAIWKKFINRANIEVAAIVAADVDQNVKKRPSFREKYEDYERDVKSIRSLIGKEKIVEVGANEDAADVITRRIQQTTK